MSNCLLCLSDFVSSPFDEREHSLSYSTLTVKLTDLSAPDSHTPTSFITPRLLCRSSLFVSPTFGQSGNRFVCPIYLGRFMLYARCRASGVTNVLTDPSSRKRRSVWHFVLKKRRNGKRLVGNGPICKIRFCFESVNFTDSLTFLQLLFHYDFVVIFRYICLTKYTTKL